MLWLLENGEQAEWLAKIKEEGQNVPRLKTVPTLSSHEMPVWRTFADLTIRRHSPSIGISLLEMRCAFEMQRLDDEEEQDWFYIINELDTVYLNWYVKKQRAEEEKAKQDAKAVKNKRFGRGK